MAIRSAQQRLKLYNHNTFPANGLAVFCGLVMSQAGRDKERLVTVDLEPMHPIKSFSYLCDKSFHVETLKALCVDPDAPSYGFIIIDGNGALFGLLQGTNRKVLQKITVDLPNKHRRGGQSALRFDRIRQEKRNVYVGKVAELATEHFLDDENKPKVAGLVLAGQAGCKDDLQKNAVFHKRLRSLVIQAFDLAYGGELGLDQAINMSAEVLGLTKLKEETQLLERYMGELSRDAGRYCVSVADTLEALELGAVEDLIVSEDLRVNRYVMRDPDSGEERVMYLTEEEEETKQGKEDQELELVKKEALLDWICDNFRSFGCRLTLVSDRSAAGRQFLQGLGGVGGLLRWSLELHDSQGSDDDGSPGIPCPGGCGFAVTWHSTHCCSACANPISKAAGCHGRKCDRLRFCPQEDAQETAEDEALSCSDSVGDFMGDSFGDDDYGF